MSFLNLWILTGIITTSLIYFIRYLFPKIGLLDNPKKYWFNREPIPYSTWIIIPVIFFWIAFFLMPINKAFIWFFISWSILSITSFIDDKINLNPLFRLFIQWICAVIIISSWIWINEILNPFWWKIDINTYSLWFLNFNFHLISDSLIFIWIILIINSINWFDWVSWNVSWIWAISWWILFFLSNSSIVAQHDIAQISLVLAIICSIFFIFEIDPPKLLIGDSWSMFVGFAIAILSIIAWWKIAITLILVAIPIIDAFYTIYRRLKKGDSPFRWDMDHLHHILLKKWLSRKSIVIAYSTICLIFWLMSLFLNTTWKYITIFLLIVITIYFENKIRKNI